MITFLIVGCGLAAIGIVLLGISNFMYFSRTNDKPFFRFWLGKDLLSTNELLVNRIGFGFTIAGITLLVIQLIILALVSSGYSVGRDKVQ